MKTHWTHDTLIGQCFADLRNNGRNAMVQFDKETNETIAIAAGDGALPTFEMMLVDIVEKQGKIIAGLRSDVAHWKAEAERLADASADGTRQNYCVSENDCSDLTCKYHLNGNVLHPACNDVNCAICGPF